MRMMLAHWPMAAFACSLVISAEAASTVGDSAASEGAKWAASLGLATMNIAVLCLLKFPYLDRNSPKANRRRTVAKMVDFRRTTAVSHP